MKNTTTTKNPAVYSVVMDMVAAKMAVKDVTIDIRPAKRGSFMIQNKHRVIEAYYLHQSNEFSLVMKEEDFQKIEKVLPKSIPHVHHDDWRMKDVITITDANLLDFQTAVLEPLANAIDARLTSTKSDETAKEEPKKEEPKAEEKPKTSDKPKASSKPKAPRKPSPKKGQSKKS